MGAAAVAALLVAAVAVVWLKPDGDTEQIAEAPGGARLSTDSNPAVPVRPDTGCSVASSGGRGGKSRAVASTSTGCAGHCGNSSSSRRQHHTNFDPVT